METLKCLCCSGFSFLVKFSPIFECQNIFFAFIVDITKVFKVVDQRFDPLFALSSVHQVHQQLLGPGHLALRGQPDGTGKAVVWNLRNNPTVATRFPSWIWKNLGDSREILQVSCFSYLS